MTQLTEEELDLQKKYAILRKHKKILSELKKQRKEALKSNSADGANKVFARWVQSFVSVQAPGSLVIFQFPPFIERLG